MRAVREGHCPELRSRTQDMYKTLSVARADFGAIGDADQVRVTIYTKSTIKFLPRCDNERLDGFPRLFARVLKTFKRVYKPDMSFRKQLTSQAITRSPDAISRAVDHMRSRQVAQTTRSGS